MSPNEFTKITLDKKSAEQIKLSIDLEQKFSWKKSSDSASSTCSVSFSCSEFSLSKSVST